MNSNKSSSADNWSAQAELYSNQASRLTELHGSDLVTILKDEILNAKTILDVGCGTGAFAKAYVQQFPRGVPGQKLILSDFSSGMLEQAESTLQLGPDFQTEIVFQNEDGTKLEGIADGSIELLVSLFGVFLIPDQEGASKAIRRVLKKPNGVFANASWQFEVSESLVRQGFGVSLQDAFELPIKIIDPEAKSLGTSVKKWATRDGAKETMEETFQMREVESFAAIHTSVWDFDFLWTVLSKNPMTNIQGASAVDVQRAKDAVTRFVTQEGKVGLEKPVMFSTASVFSVGRSSIDCTLGR